MGLWWAVSIPCSAMAGDARGGGVRPSALQGVWYPGEPGALRGMVERFLSRAVPPVVQGRVLALVVPHAGYRYSGPVAAHAYRLIRGMDVERVVLIGPSHRWDFNGISVAGYDAYETPLGRVPVDRDMARRLVKADPAFCFVPQAHAAEHCLEIQLPFLQTVLGAFEIVPVLMRRMDTPTCSLLAGSLVRAMEDGKRTLLIASTDLSHYHTDRTARDLDGRFMRYLEAFDPEGLTRALAARRCEACGGGPTAAVLMAARRLGAERCEILDYATSGDATGDRDRVVGYVAAALTGSAGSP